MIQQLRLGGVVVLLALVAYGLQVVTPDSISTRMAYAQATTTSANTLCRAGTCTTYSAPEVTDYTGDCILAKVRIYSQGTHIGATIRNWCATIDPSDATQILANVNASGEWAVQPAPSSGYTLVRTQGDCEDSYYEVRDDYLGTTYSFNEKNVCATIPTSGIGVMDYMRSRGVRPVHTGAGRGLYNARCDYSVTPQNYIATLTAIPKASTRWRTVCFSAGTYTTPIQLNSYQNLALDGAGKNLTFWTANWPIPADAQTNPDAITAILDIRSSKNIVVSNMTIYNTKPYINNGVIDNDQVSRALTVSYTDGFVAKDAIFKSEGKVPAEISTSPLGRFYRTDFSGSYFSFSGDYGGYLVDGGSIKQNLAGDQHSLTWSAGAHIFYKGVSADTPTGQSFVAGGIIGSGNQNIRVENLSTPTPLDSWMQQHPNYGDIHVHLYAPYPTSTVDYWYNPAGGGGTGPNNWVYRHGTCVPLAPETQSLSCPTGQSGNMTQTRTSSCPADWAPPVWSAWTTTANSCATSAYVPLGYTVQTNASATGYPASNMQDGSSTTMWVASLNPVGANNTGFIAIDLGIKKYIDTIFWSSWWSPYPASTLADFTIKIGDTPTALTTVVTKTNPAGTSAPYQYAFPIGQNARYIRIDHTKINDGTGWAASMKELVVQGACVPLAPETQTLGCPAGQTGSTTQTRTSSCTTSAGSPTWNAWETTTNTCAAIVNVPLTYTVQTNAAAAGYPASNMQDGSSTTLWVASLNPVGANNVGYIIVDLGTSKYVDSVSWSSWWSPYPASTLADFTIKIGDSLSALTTAVTKTNPAGTSAPYQYAFPIGQSARYIRIDHTKINDGTGWAASMKELVVSGHAL